MTIYCSAQLRRMSVADLEKVLSWRNAPEVRRYMYTQHEIGLDEHTRWFERASEDSNRHLLIFESQRVDLGFINIHKISHGGIADWGFYAAPDAPKGSGRQLGYATLNYAFTELGYTKLCAQALIYNERSIRFHLKLGFQQEGVLRHQYFDGQRYHDVVCFGLLASEWHINN